MRNLILAEVQLSSSKSAKCKYQKGIVKRYPMLWLWSLIDLG